MFFFRLFVLVFRHFKLFGFSAMFCHFEITSLLENIVLQIIAIVKRQTSPRIVRIQLNTMISFNFVVIKFRGFSIIGNFMDT